MIRRLENDRLAAVMMAAAGAEGVELPDVEQEWQRFEDALNNPPPRQSAGELNRIAVRTALGLAAVPERGH